MVDGGVALAAALCAAASDARAASTTSITGIILNSFICVSFSIVLVRGTRIPTHSTGNRGMFVSERLVPFTARPLHAGFTFRRLGFGAGARARTRRRTD